MPPAPPWNVFPYHRPTSALSFPRDEGWHSLLPGGLANPSPANMEWVYMNSHLEEIGGAGRKFVVFAAYFTQGLRFLVVRAWDSADRYLGAWTGTALGILTASAERLDVKYRHLGGVDHWRAVELPGGGIDPFHSQLTAIDDAGAFQVDLDLTCTKRPYEAGGIGWLPFGRHGWFGYYSLTRLGVTGALRLPLAGGGVEEVKVSGFGWYDHQWGPFFVTPLRISGLEEYEWMSIQLDSGDEILLTTVWDTTGETPDREAFGGAGLIRSDGTFDRLVGQSRWKRTKFWRSPSQGAIYSAGWTFDAPEWDTHLVIAPRHPDQLTPLLDSVAAKDIVARLGTALLEGPVDYLGDFWEGSCRVTGTFAGKPVTGFAFAELVKRYRDPELEVHVPRSDADATVLAWRAKDWDVQAPLTYRVYLEEKDGTVLAEWKGLDVSVLVLDDPGLPRGRPLVARIVASSVDGTLTKTATVPLELR